MARSLAFARKSLAFGKRIMSGAWCAQRRCAFDFYGPKAPTSVLSTLGVARLLAGKPALAPYPPDQPHDFTYVPDFARALIDAGASPILGNFPFEPPMMVSQPSRAGVEGTMHFPANSKIDLTEVAATTWISLL
jgi:hypothetical protein